MEQTTELPAMRRSAELAPNTADADTRTVEVVWSAGARVRRATFFGEPYDEELSLDPAHVRLDRLNAGAPFLKVHALDTLDAGIGSIVLGSPRNPTRPGPSPMSPSPSASGTRASPVAMP